MDDQLWFEEEIFPPEGLREDLIAGIKSMNPAELAELVGDSALESLAKGWQTNYAEEIAGKGLRGIIRAHKPAAWRAVPGEGPLGATVAAAVGTPYLIKLTIEFDLPEELKDSKYRYKKYQYKKVWCRAYISATGDCRPRVLDVMPNRLYEGEPRTITVALTPTLKLAEVEAGLGGVTTSIQVGVVAPATTGWLGDEQRAPYWEMTEVKKEIKGYYNFWFLLDLPNGCEPASVRLSMLGEGDLRLHRFSIPAGPKHRQRQNHQTVTLQELLR